MVGGSIPQRFGALLSAAQVMGAYAKQLFLPEIMYALAGLVLDLVGAMERRQLCFRDTRFHLWAAIDRVVSI